jgi:hypothetical protein
LCLKHSSYRPRQNSYRLFRLRNPNMSCHRSDQLRSRILFPYLP